ncbi:alkaline phosphatase [Siminovitchia sp. 179-K 8D1 HS]|uniref:alkaline phosphatase n=1 Tax=Siminovitchia sp. 179-K 8D1 HS TaxID=3142385 RepID=UPI00399FEC81
MAKKILALFLLFGTPFLAPWKGEENHSNSLKKNVIFMVMDGTNADVITLARHYKGAPLALDSILTGGVKTYSSQSAITDSAAAASAMATGHKTLKDYIGMVPYQAADGKNRGRPVANIMEAAKAKGLATGIVATSPVQHATPAAFSSHTMSRHNMHEIGKQQAHQNIDILLGGGKRYSSVNEGRDVQIVRTKSELDKAKGKSLHGYFAEEEMAYDMDRKKLKPEQPSLADMTKKALGMLSSHPKGFFLFIEGSKVDYAGHKNDPVGMISEALAFDAAVEEALAFAKKHPNTLLIAVADHGNSGLTMGNKQTDQTYAETPAEMFVNPLKKASLTVTGAVSLLKKDRSNLEEVLHLYGLDGLEQRKIRKIRESRDIEKELVSLMAERAHLGFTTRGHSGEDVFLYSFGPKKPAGLINNTDLPTKVAAHLELDSLSELTNKLFIPAKDYYEKRGYETENNIKRDSDAVFVAKKGKTVIEYPANENKRKVNGREETLPGIVVFNGDTFWIPK